MRMRRLLFVGMAIATLLLLWVTRLNASPTVPEAPIPSVIQPCLPPTPRHFPQPYRFELVGKASNPQARGRQMKEFYLLDVYRPWDAEDFPWDTLIGVDTTGKCFDFIGQNAAYVTLTAYMPRDLARAIAFQRFSHWLLHPDGEERIQTLLRVETPEMFGEDAGTSPEPTVLAPEDAWALQALGYAIPSEVHVLPELTPYQPQ